MIELAKPAILGSLLVTLLAPTGWAQSPLDTDAEAQRRQRPVLEEVIVTAQKREEDMQFVALSITAISGDDIVGRNMADMNEVADYVPNLDVLAIPTFPSVYMRGLGSSYNRGFEQSVAILIDEVFYGRASYINQGLLDLAAIEVLRGPQGTLFGKNSSAGAIHFRSAEPEYEFGLHGDVLFGERNLRRYRMAVTGPLIDNRLAWRLALLSDHRDGAIENSTSGIQEENRDVKGARLRLNWDVRDDLSLGLILNANQLEQDGPGTQLIKVRGRALAAMRVFDPRVEDDPYDEHTAMDHPGATRRDTYDAVIRADWTLANDVVLSSISSYSWLDEEVSFDADFSPIPFLILDNNEDMRQFSQEFRITSAPGRLEYVGGLYYLETDIKASYDITNFLELPEILLVTGEVERILCTNISPDPRGCQDAALDDAAMGELAGQLIKSRIDAEGGASPVESSLTRFNQRTRSAALFGQFTWHFTERWSLTAGGRLNYEEKRLDISNRLLNNRTGEEGNTLVSGEGGLPILGYGLGGVLGGSIIFPLIIPGSQQFSAERSRYEFNVIPKLSTQYAFSDAAMAYLTVARGYKSGGYNAQPVNADQLEFDKEDALTYEIGVKSEWLGGAARLNISAFHTDFDGLQVATFDGFSYIVGNAASATVKGIEYEAMLLFNPGILLGLNGAFTDATYDKFPTGPCGAEVIEPPPCDLSGERLRLVPDVKATLTLGYEGQWWRLPFNKTFGLTATYNSDVALATDLNTNNVRESGTTYGVQLGIKALDERWRVMVFGNNVGNRKYLAGGQDVPTFRGSYFGGAYPLRNFELELGLAF